MVNAEWTIARLQARVAALERQLIETSAIYRAFVREVCEEDVINASRAAAGLPPLARAGFGLRGWRETTSLVPGDVEKTMIELWRSVTPPNLGDSE